MVMQLMGSVCRLMWRGSDVGDVWREVGAQLGEQPASGPWIGACGDGVITGACEITVSGGGDEPEHGVSVLWSAYGVSNLPTFHPSIQPSKLLLSPPFPLFILSLSRKLERIER